MLLFFFATLSLPFCFAEILEDGQLLPRASYAVYTNESVALLCSFDRAVRNDAPADYEMIWYRENASVSRSDLPRLSDVQFVPLVRVIGSQIELLQNVAQFDANSFELIPVSAMRATSILLIKRVRLDHAGFYRCELNGIRGKIMHFRVEVSQSVLTIDVNETRVAALPHSSMTLLCYVGDSKPPPTVYWTREPIVDKRSRLQYRRDAKSDTIVTHQKTAEPIFAYGEVLRFQNFTRKEAWTYICHVENYVNPPSEMPIELHYAEAWKIEALYNSISPGFAINATVSLLPKLNEVYILTCRVRTFLKVQFAWFKNGVQLQGLTAIDSHVFFHVLVKPKLTESHLVFKSFRPADKAYYSCRVSDRFRSTKEYGFAVNKIQNEGLTGNADAEEIGDYSGAGALNNNSSNSVSNANANANTVTNVARPADDEDTKGAKRTEGSAIVALPNDDEDAGDDEEDADETDDTDNDTDSDADDETDEEDGAAFLRTRIDSLAAVDLDESARPAQQEEAEEEDDSDYFEYGSLNGKNQGDRFPFSTTYRFADGVDEKSQSKVKSPIDAIESAAFLKSSNAAAKPRNQLPLLLLDLGFLVVFLRTVFYHAL